MAATLRKFFKWWLYLLSVNFLAKASLAKTNSFTHELSKDKVELDEEVEDSGVTFKNLTISKGRSLKCVPMIKHFEVELTEPLKPGEGVGLTGDRSRQTGSMAN